MQLLSVSANNSDDQRICIDGWVGFHKAKENEEY